MPCNVRFHLRQLQPLVPHSTWWWTVLHGRRGGSTEGPDHAVRGQMHRDSWQLLPELPLAVDLWSWPSCGQILLEGSLKAYRKAV